MFFLIDVIFLGCNKKSNNFLSILTIDKNQTHSNKIKKKDKNLWLSERRCCVIDCNFPEACLIEENTSLHNSDNVAF